MTFELKTQVITLQPFEELKLRWCGLLNYFLWSAILLDVWKEVEVIPGSQSIENVMMFYFLIYKGLEVNWNPARAYLSHTLTRLTPYLHPTHFCIPCHTCSTLQLFHSSSTAVLKQSIRQSQVTSLLNLTKSHRGHSKNHQKPQKMVQKGHIFLQIAIKFPNIVIWQNQNFMRQVTGHSAWQIDCFSY